MLNVTGDIVIPKLAKKAPELKSSLLKANKGAFEAIEDYCSFCRLLLKKPGGRYAIGQKLFNKILKEYHFLDYDCKSLWNLGHKLLQESVKEQSVISKKINPKKSLKQVLKQIKSSHPSKAGLVKAYKDAMRKSREFVIRKDLVNIPKNESLKVMETPEFERPLLPYAAYMPAGTYDKRQIGYLWVTPVDEFKSKSQQRRQLEEHPWGIIKNVSLHEGYPGHHLQITYGNLSKSAVLKRFWSNLYVEGWAFYFKEISSGLSSLLKPSSKTCALENGPDR